MSLAHRPVRLALLLGAVMTIAAEDRPLGDLRLQLGSGPSRADTEFTVSAFGGSVSSSDEETADSAWQFGIGYVGAFDPLTDGAGALWSVGLVSTGYEVELDNDEQRRFSTVAIELGFGLAIPLARGFHLEAAPFAAIGVASGEIEYNTGSDIDGDAFYWAIGARAGAFYTFTNGLQLGLELRYTHSGATFEDEDTIFGVEVESEVDLTLSGVGVLGSIGYRF